MSHHIGAALADEHRKTLTAQAEAAGRARQARLHRQTARRSRATVTAGVVAVAALLGGVAAAVVAAPAGAQPTVKFQGAPAGPEYDPAQFASKSVGTQYQDIQLADVFEGARPTIQLTVMFEDAVPRPNYDA